MQLTRDSAAETQCSAIVSSRGSHVQSDHTLSRWTLRLDGIFLLLAGSAAMLTETIGHFFGVGPLASTRGSPHTIGGFEAHGLAIIIGVLLLYAARRADRRLWHTVGLCTHLLLGSANVLFWSSFVRQDLVLVGIVTTALHAIFVVAQAICLRAGASSA
jgi:hypothetical protein